MASESMAEADERWFRGIDEPEHTPCVERYQPYPDSILTVYYAVCNCGWRGRTRSFVTDAQDDANEHDEQAA